MVIIACIVLWHAVDPWAAAILFLMWAGANIWIEMNEIWDFAHGKRPHLDE